MQVVQVVPALWRAHLYRLSRLRTCRSACGGLLSCVPSFCPLSRFALVALPLKYAFIRVLGGFLGGFGVLVWVCVVLVLCVACGALYA